MIFCTKNLAESQKSCIFVAYKQSNGNIDILNILGDYIRQYPDILVAVN